MAPRTYFCSAMHCSRTVVPSGKVCRGWGGCVQRGRRHGWLGRGSGAASRAALSAPCALCPTPRPVPYCVGVDGVGRGAGVGEAVLAQELAAPGVERLLRVGGRAGRRAAVRRRCLAALGGACLPAGRHRDPPPHGATTHRPTHRGLLQGEHADGAVEEVGVCGHVVEGPRGQGEVQAVPDAWRRVGKWVWVGWVGEMPCESGGAV